VEKPTPTPPVVEKPTPTPPVVEKPTPTPPVVEKPTPTPPVVEKPTPTPPVVEKPTPTPPVVEKPTPTPPVVEKPTPPVAEQSTPVVAKAPDVAPVDNTKVITDNGSGTIAGVNYSVQIAAMQRRVPVEYYTSTYNISDPVNIEPVDGLNKYTTGLFKTYNDARNHREVIRGKGVEGPFVTAYSNGRRITVQEALMITNQPWVK
jgi:hypothetical protein